MDVSARAKRARFEADVMPHLDSAYRFARWLSNSSADAEDIVHDAMLRAFRAFDGHRGVDAKAWVLSIVRNCHATARMQKRRRAHVPLPEGESGEDGPAMVAMTPDPLSASIAEEHSRLCARLLAKLSDEYREVLILKEFEDMSYREIAAIVQVPLGTVMSRLSRARGALKAQWLAETEGELRVVR